MVTHYTCPMHPEVKSITPGSCPKCGMRLEKDHSGNNSLDPHEAKHGSHSSSAHDHSSHDLTKRSSFWEKFRMSMTMTMGMEHTGLAGREMARIMEEDIRNKFIIALLLTIPIILYSPLGETFLGLQLPSPIPSPWLLFFLATPVFFYSGWIFLFSTYKALQHRTLNMAVLIAVGTTAAYGASVLLLLLGSTETYFEAAAMLITFVLFGHWMEMKSRRGTTDALQALFALIPPQARVIRNGKEVLVPTADIQKGDIILLKPGDKVPVDGEIIEGETAIDESLVTGESIPVEKQKGDTVIGGSINQSGSVRFRATKVGDETALAQIVKMVETAQNSKAPGQKMADAFAKYLVVLAVGAGILTFVGWYFVFNQSFLFALSFAISAVVIACPDALGLATPTAVAVGTGVGAKHNILIKDAPTLEQVSKIQAIVLDKTGTLTQGKPVITDIVTIDSFSKDEAIRLIAGAESKSNHPLSGAVLDELKKRKITIPKTITAFRSIAGHGVEATVDGEKVTVGTLRLMHEKKVNVEPLQGEIDRLLRQGKTLMILAVNGKVSGVVAAADPVKPNAKYAVQKMQALGLEVAMITGDNQKTAEAVATELGISRVFAEVLPEDKAKYVKKLQSEGKFVAMVGDGVNDAPALAQADIGIAIGAGTDVAIETANVVLMKSDPLDILRAIILSKATVQKMRENLFWASIYNVLAIPIAAGVLYPSFGISLRPEFAALLMSVSSIIVATNAILLQRVDGKLTTI